jgi:hypothetical protein
LLSRVAREPPAVVMASTLAGPWRATIFRYRLARSSPGDRRVGRLPWVLVLRGAGLLTTTRPEAVADAEQSECLPRFSLISGCLPVTGISGFRHCPLSGRVVTCCDQRGLRWGFC